LNGSDFVSVLTVVLGKSQQETMYINFII